MGHPGLDRHPFFPLISALSFLGASPPDNAASADADAGPRRAGYAPVPRHVADPGPAGQRPGPAPHPRAAGSVTLDSPFPCPQSPPPPARTVLLADHCAVCGENGTLGVPACLFRRRVVEWFCAGRGSFTHPMTPASPLYRWTCCCRRGSAAGRFRSSTSRATTGGQRWVRPFLALLWYTPLMVPHRLTCAA